MDAAHLHLVLNHVPVLGTIFGLLLLLFGLMRREVVLVKTSLVVFVVSGVAAGAAYLTGEPAEEFVEHLAGVSAAAVESHENAGFYALISAGVLGLFALGGLFFFNKRLPRPFAVTVVILALAVGGMMAWTANLGGQIRHSEIRSDAVTQQTESGADPESFEPHDEDDEADP